MDCSGVCSVWRNSKVMWWRSLRPTSRTESLISYRAPTVFTAPLQSCTPRYGASIIFGPVVWFVLISMLKQFSSKNIEYKYSKSRNYYRNAIYFLEFLVRIWSNSYRYQSSLVRIWSNPYQNSKEIQNGVTVVISRFIIFILKVFWWKLF